MDVSTAPSAPSGVAVPTSAPKRSASPEPDPATLEALRSSYPDASLAPPKIKAILEKADKADKHSTVNWQECMNQQTQKLAAAQELLNNVKEAKANHRRAWIKHLQDSATLWKSHSAAFAKQQAHFNSVITKTKEEIKEAGQSVTELTQDAATIEANEAKAQAEAALEEEQEAEESTLKAHLHQILKDCIDLTEDDVIEVDAEETEEGAPKKRTRTVELGKES